MKIEYIHVKGSGTEEKPIIISSYGDESKPLPLINTNGKGVWYQDYNLASLDSEQSCSARKYLLVFYYMTWNI
ncbi:MAG: hypothetical protein ACLTN0_06000 [Coprococcus phoceensis]